MRARPRTAPAQARRCSRRRGSLPDGFGLCSLESSPLLASRDRGLHRFGRLPHGRALSFAGGAGPAQCSHRGSDLQTGHRRVFCDVVDGGCIRAILRQRRPALGRLVARSGVRCLSGSGYCRRSRDPRDGLALARLAQLHYRYLDLRRGPWRDPDFRPAAHARQLQCIFRRSGDAYRAAPDRTVDRDPRAGRLDSGPYRTGICGTGNGLARIRRSRGLDFRAGPGRQGAGACRRAGNYRWTNCCGTQPP